MTRKQDESFMRIALIHAEKALQQGWIPVGAVFAKDNQIVAHGCKTGINHTLFDHAEHNACYQALWAHSGPRNLKGFTVYSTLEPCLMCLSLIMTTRVSRIVYALEDPYGGGCCILKNPALLPPRFQREHPRLTGGILANESKALLRRFFEKQRALNSAHWADRKNPLVRLAFSD